jgi:protein involved in polysaccharide export with SLBB domain
MKRFLLSSLMILVSVLAVAQSASMLSMARSELDKRGLTEAEVRARLVQDGIYPEAIPPSDYPRYQGRVMAILDELQAQKAASSSEVANTGVAATVTVGGETVPQVEVAVPVAAADVPQTTMGEAAAEAALEEALEEAHVSPTAGNNIYGHSMFTGKSLDVFRTTDGAQAPDTYILGEGDEVHISIFGSSQTEIHQRIAADGSIQPAGSSKIFLKGLTLAQGRTLIRSRLAQHYSFRPDQIAVTITTARTITISIFGEVGVQGGFTLSALNTAFNALAAAGGPTARGSIRNIQLSRGGKVSRLDLYTYMTNPTAGLPYDLQNNDVIFVPIAQTLVDIEGGVKRPMKYEMIEGEDLTDLIGYAGGLTYDVYPEFVQIERTDNGEVSYQEYKLKDVMDGKVKVAMMPGDVVRIKSANRPVENYVRINGDVYYGGTFDYEQNKSLKALIEKAEPKYTARKDYVFVERTSPDETVEILTVPFPGEDGNPDFQLEQRDVVTVLALDSYLEKWTIGVSGEVRNPFSRTFGLNDVMTLGQAIEYAGGPSHSARTDFVYVERTRPDQTVEILTLPFPEKGSESYDFPLQAKDQIRVLSLTSFRDVDQISVQGQVRSPFTRTFGLNDRMTVSQAIEYANGLKPSVFPVAYITRTDISNPEKKEYIRVDLNKDGETLLQPGDVLRVYDNTTYTNIGEVRVSGAVQNSVGVTYDPSITVHDLIMMAGGFSVGAAYDKVQVFRVNISKTDEVQYDLITLTVDEDYNPTDPNFVLQPYDHIVVRMTPNFATDRVVEINGRVRYPGVYVLNDSRTHLSEIIKMAGGLLDDADPYSSIFRTYRNRGRISIDLKKAKAHRRNMAHDPILMAGDVLNINRQENTVIIRPTGTRMNQYVAEDFVSDEKLVVFKGRHRAAWYVKNYAGGFDKYADRKSVTVTLPNNQSKGTKQFIFRATPIVEPGSVITLRMNQDKIDDRNRKMEEPKNKVDFESVVAKTLSGITSVVSIIILSRNLLKTTN